MLLLKAEHRILGFAHILPSFGYKNLKEFSLFLPIPSDSLQIKCCILVLINTALTDSKASLDIQLQIQSFISLEEPWLQIFPFLKSILIAE